MSKKILPGMKKEYFDENTSTHERGIFLPLIQNETKQQRANRILSMMTQSNERLSRVLDVFNRMNL